MYHPQHRYPSGPPDPRSKSQHWGKHLHPGSSDRGKPKNKRSRAHPASQTNLHQDKQSGSIGGGSANKRQLAQIYQSQSRTVTGFSALKITEGKGSHFITFDRTGSWSRQVSAGEQPRHRTPLPSLASLRWEAKDEQGQG